MESGIKNKYRKMGIRKEHVLFTSEEPEAMLTAL